MVAPTERNIAQTDHSSPRSIAGYDRLSSVYRWIEWLAFGGALMRARKSLVGDLAPADHILVLGDGDGRLLVELTQSQPTARFTSIEQSLRMLKLQRSRLCNIGSEVRVELIQADATLPEHFQHQFDTVVAAFFLDCFDTGSLDRLLPNLLNSIPAGGEFYFVDFTEPSARLPRIYAKLMLWLMHRFFAWQTGLKTHRLVDVQKKLSDLGWETKHHQDHHFKMITARIFKRVKKLE